MYILTECIHDNDLILAHALAGVVICKFTCVEEGALNAFPAETKYAIKTAIHNKAGVMSISFKTSSLETVI